MKNLVRVSFEGGYKLCFKDGTSDCGTGDPSGHQGAEHSQETHHQEPDRKVTLNS